MLQGNEPLHSALDVALVHRRTIKAIIGGVLAYETPCGGARYVGSGLSKYEGMRWITSIQLSITLASIPFKILSDFVTSNYLIACHISNCTIYRTT